MSLESFYGGRQGASFVIVKHFDGIDIPQPDTSGKYTFTGNYYAVDNNQKLILSGGKPIERDSSNQNTYSWAYYKHDSSISVPTSTGGTYSFADVLAEGMVQCFEQGATSSSEVNYGEYVIIDTIVNLHDKNNDDNGKVFRRGMDYQAALAGAEYIGQIVGPQGETPEVDITHYLDIVNLNPHKQDVYNPVQQDIIPGSYIDGTGVRQFEDEIKFAYATMKDAAGNVVGCQIGFQIPTLVQEFEASSISPYTNRVPGTSGFNSKYTNLIVEDSSEWDGQNWQHPFYEKWQISIPQGYHGINSTNIEIIPTFTKPAYSSATESYPGTVIYQDAALTIPIIISLTEVELLRDADYDSDPSVPYAKVMYAGVLSYVKKEDCYKDIVRYRETNFDNTQTGDVTYYEIGDYNSIDKVTLSEDGILTVFYKSTGPAALEEAVRWIDKKDTNGIDIDADGSIHIYFNTTHTPNPSDPLEKLNSKGMAHDRNDYPTVLDWIEDVSLTQAGAFKVLFNNNSLPNLPIDSYSGHSVYKTTLQWVDYLDVTNDGNIRFYYNTDHTTPMYESKTSGIRIKYIKDITFNSTDGTPGALEGSGDQKFVVTYNTTDAAGNYEKENNTNWAAMNYIIESKVYIPISGFSNTNYAYHLIAIFSDPAYRAKFPNISYPSDKFGQVYNEWVDLGYVRGEKGGLHTVTNVPNVNDLYDDNGVAIPPEYLLTAVRDRAATGSYVWQSGVDADYMYAGWGATVEDVATGVETIYFYDYGNLTWFKVGTIDTSLVSPDTVIMKSTPDGSTMAPSAADDKLHDEGFWLAAETAIYVN